MPRYLESGIEVRDNTDVVRLSVVHDTEVLVVYNCPRLTEICVGPAVKKIHVRSCPMLHTVDTGTAEDVAFVDCLSLTVGRLPHATRVYVAGCAGVWWGAWFWPKTARAGILCTPVILTDTVPPALEGFATDSRALIDHLPTIPADLLVLHALAQQEHHTKVSFLGTAHSVDTPTLLVPAGPTRVVLQNTQNISTVVLDDTVASVLLMDCPDTTRVLGDGIQSWSATGCPRLEGAFFRTPLFPTLADHARPCRVHCPGQHRPSLPTLATVGQHHKRPV